MIRSMRVVALVSGPDSLAMFGELERKGLEVLPLYVRCGFRWEAAELAALRRAGLRPAVLEAPMRSLMRRHWSMTGRDVPGPGADAAVGLPGRNVVLLTEAWLYAASRGADAVAFGTLKTNPFPDATPRFRRAIETALNLGFGARIRLLAPLAGRTKAQVLRGGAAGFSCLSPRRGRPCGRCNKCAELADVRAGRPSSRPSRARRRAPARAASPRAGA